MAKKAEMKLVGFAMIAIGLALAFMPELVALSPLGAILPIGETGAGALGVTWSIGNNIVTANTPFVLNAARAVDYSRGEPYPARTTYLKFYVAGKLLASQGIPTCHWVAPGTNVACASALAPIEIQQQYFAERGKVLVTVNVEERAGQTVTEPEQWVYDFEVWVDDKACVTTPNQMLVLEAFTAGRTIAKADLRFPVKAFCAKTPVLVQSGGFEQVTESQCNERAGMWFEEYGCWFGQTIEQNLEIYNLIENSYATVPANQVWIVFYVADVSPDISVVCKPDPESGLPSAYDPESKECVVSPPIVFSCSGDAVFDPAQYACVSQPETRVVCEYADAVYDVSLGKCVKIIPKALTVIKCEQGSYNTATGECVDTVTKAVVKCESGSYNAATGECEVLKPAVAVCPQNSAAVVDQSGDIVKCVFEAPAATEWVCESGHLDASVDPPVCREQAKTQLSFIELPVVKLLGRDVSIVLLALGLSMIVLGMVVITRK